MFNNKVVVIIALAVICNSSALADPLAVAYSSYGNSMEEVYQNPSLDNINADLRETVYEIQQESSSIKLRVRSPIGDVWVGFNAFEGDFVLRGNNENGKVASIEVNSSSMENRRGMVKALLKSSGFLDVENYPRIEFAGSSIDWFSDTQAILKGAMTIRGVTRDVDFYMELVDSGNGHINAERVSVKVTATIKRSEFGITTLLPVVGDEVSLFIDVNATKKDTSLSMN